MDGKAASRTRYKYDLWEAMWVSFTRNVKVLSSHFLKNQPKMADLVATGDWLVLVILPAAFSVSVQTIFAPSSTYIALFSLFLSNGKAVLNRTDNSVKHLLNKPIFSRLWMQWTNFNCGHPPQITYNFAASEEVWMKQFSLFSFILMSNSYCQCSDVITPTIYMICVMTSLHQHYILMKGIFSYLTDVQFLKSKV